MTAMTLHEFKTTLSADEAPGVAPLLLALWHDARGDWNEAHRLAQDVETTDGAWVHAYLHRKEGSASNAEYWYERAGRKFQRPKLEDEFQALVEGLLGENP